MAALAVGDEDPPVAQVQVGHAQTEDLAAPQAPQHHGLDHRPVPVRAKRAEQGLHLVGVQDPWHPSHAAHEWDSLSASQPALAGGEALGAPGSRSHRRRLG